MRANLKTLFLLVSLLVCPSLAQAQYPDAEKARSNLEAYQTGRDYLEGSNGRAKDALKAIEWLKPPLQNVVQRFGWTKMGFRVCQHPEWYQFKPWSDLKDNETDPALLYQLGIKYRQGYGGVKDRNKAKSYFIRAAQAGHGLAQMEAADFLLGEDEAAALDFKHKASAQGNVAATYSIALHYETGGFGIAQDIQIAAQWYAKAYEQISEHMTCYRRQIDLGDTDAAYYLTLFYQTGLVEPYAMEQDIAYLQMAADGGLDVAQSILGDYLTKDIHYQSHQPLPNDDLIKSNCQKAAGLYDKARSNAYGYAARGRAMLMDVCNENNQDQQISLYLESIENSVPFYFATYDLARLYFSRQNYYEAYKWYKIESLKTLNRAGGVPLEFMNKAAEKLTAAQKEKADKEVQ